MLALGRFVVCLSVCAILASLVLVPHYASAAQCAKDQSGKCLPNQRCTTNSGEGIYKPDGTCGLTEDSTPEDTSNVSPKPIPIGEQSGAALTPEQTAVQTVPSYGLLQELNKQEEGTAVDQQNNLYESESERIKQMECSLSLRKDCALSPSPTPPSAPQLDEMLKRLEKQLEPTQKGPNISEGPVPQIWQFASFQGATFGVGSGGDLQEASGGTELPYGSLREFMDKDGNLVAVEKQISPFLRRYLENLGIDVDELYPNGVMKQTISPDLPNEEAPLYFTPCVDSEPCIAGTLRSITPENPFLSAFSDGNFNISDGGGTEIPDKDEFKSPAQLLYPLTTPFIRFAEDICKLYFSCDLRTDWVKDLEPGPLQLEDQKSLSEVFDPQKQGFENSPVYSLLSSGFYEGVPAPINEKLATESTPADRFFSQSWSQMLNEIQPDSVLDMKSVGPEIQQPSEATVASPQEPVPAVTPVPTEAKQPEPVETKPTEPLQPAGLPTSLPPSKDGDLATTLTEWYETNHMPLPSVSERRDLFNALGLAKVGERYTGTVAQNARLLQALKDRY